MEYTQEQIQDSHKALLAAVREAEKRILPAKLVDPAKDGANGFAIAAHIKQHNLAPTADNFFAAIQALYRTLEWQVKPRKLLMEEQNEKPAVLKSARESENAFVAGVRAGEVKDALKAADEASIKQAKALIEGFNPVKGNRYDARLREDSQKSWTAALEKAIQSKANLQQFVLNLTTTRDAAYKRIEAASERM